MALWGRRFSSKSLDSGDFPLPNGFPPPVSELPAVEVIEIERPQLPAAQAAQAAQAVEEIEGRRREIGRQRRLLMSVNQGPGVPGRWAVAYGL